MDWVAETGVPREPLSIPQPTPPRPPDRHQPEQSQRSAGEALSQVHVALDSGRRHHNSCVDHLG